MIENLQQTFFLFFLLTIFIPTMLKDYEAPEWFMVAVLSVITLTGSGAVATTVMSIWAN